MTTGQWACAECGFALWTPLDAPALLNCRVGLYDDARFPGRCIVVSLRHVEHLESLDPAGLAAFWADVGAVGRAVRRVTGAARVNYAVLGNATAHLHAHVIPRQPDLEDLPTRPPWNDPRPLGPLSGNEREDISRQLGTHLGAGRV